MEEKQDSPRRDHGHIGEIRKISRRFTWGGESNSSHKANARKVNIEAFKIEQPSKLMPHHFH
jgi:hypothetical protein